MPRGPPEARSAYAPHPRPPAVRMRGIHKRFGAVQANRDVDLTVAPARCTASSARTAPARAR
jgi:hypothetical protein